MIMGGSNPVSHAFNDMRATISAHRLRVIFDVAKEAASNGFGRVPGVVCG
jgi:hypothetical protein